MDALSLEDLEPAAYFVPIERLRPWDDNPRDNDHAVPEVAASIKRFGFGATIVGRLNADKTVEVLAGHTRLKAALELGLKTVPVRLMDLDPVDGHLYALADNKKGELANWSAGLAEVLADFDEGVDLAGLGWDDEELEALLAEVGDGGGGDETGDLPEVPEVPESKVGEVYQLGPHRLVCGDSTDPEVWALLMEGEALQVVWTDPPYGVAYVGGARAEAEGTERDGIENDDLDEEGTEALLRASLGHALKYSKPGASWYVCADPGPRGHASSCVLKDFGVWRWSLAWVKESFTLGRGDYHPRYERIFYGWKPGAAHYFIDDRTQDTVLECPRPRASEDHPTMKPLALVVRCLGNSAKPGWIVGDAFTGSGTTLIAASSLDMMARCIEKKPGYCDRIRTRWGNYAREHNLDAGTGAL